MNLNENEEKEIQDDLKRKFGINVNVGETIKKFNITTDVVEGAIMKLLNEERIKHAVKFTDINVRVYLVEKKKLLSSKKAHKLRLKTTWIKDGTLHFDPEDRKLMSYTDVDLLAGGMISRIFADILSDFYEGHQDVIKDKLDTSIYIQFEIVDGEPCLAMNFVNGKNPKHIIEKLDMSKIFG
jgi:hypothetical protein